VATVKSAQEILAINQIAGEELHAVALGCVGAGLY